MGEQMITFGGLRPQCPATAIAVASGGNLSAGSAWLGIARINRVGFDIASTLQQITWTNGQKIVFTLASSLRAAGEDLHRILIIGAPTNNPAQASPLAWWRGYTLQSVGGGYFTEALNALPATIELTQPEHVITGGVVANPTQLAAIANPYDGMQRWVTSLSKLYYYDPTSTKTVNGDTVLSAGISTGRWLLWWYPSTFSVGSITNTTAVRGANRDSRSLVDSDVVLPPPVYRMDNTKSSWVTYCLFNGTSETGTAIDAGTRILIEVSQAGALKSQLFSRRIVRKVLGIVRFSDGTLSTTGISLGESDYEYGSPIYTLEQALPPGYGVAIAFAFRFAKEELDGGVQNGSLAITPFFSNQAGSYFAAHYLVGNIMFPEGDRRRVFPKPGAVARVAGGTGAVHKQIFDPQPATDLTIPVTGQTDLKITVNGNGAAFYRGTATNNATEVTRAIVGLRSGRSNPSAWSSYLALTAGQSLTVTVTYPTTVRADYPDIPIRGAGAAQGAALNAPNIVLYVQRQSTGEIREYANFLTVAGASQSFNVTDFTGTVIGSLPSTAGNFGCWASDPAPVAAANSGGTFAADSYRVAWALRYDGSTLTDISHSTSAPANCVPELDQTISQIAAAVANFSNAIAGWQDGTANIDVLNLLVRGDVDFRADEFDLNSDAAGSGADWRYTLRRPATGMSANQILTLPVGNGQAEQAIVGDGAGVLQYASVTRNRQIALAHNSSSVTSWFTLPANASLELIEFFLATAFNGTTPLVSVGISGNNTKYIASADLNLKAVINTRFRFYNQNPASSSAEPLIITYTASSSNAGTGTFIARYSV